MNIYFFSQQQIQELEATLYNALQQDKVCLYFTTYHIFIKQKNHNRMFFSVLMHQHLVKCQQLHLCNLKYLKGEVLFVLILVIMQIPLT